MIHSLKLKPTRRAPRIFSGHLWAYQSEIESLDKIPPGSVCDLHDWRGKFIGRGYVNPKSQISFRLLSEQKEDFDQKFFTRILTTCIQQREQEGLLTEPCRLVFSEGDLLPGFTVDSYPLRSLASGTSLASSKPSAIAENFGRHTLGIHTIDSSLLVVVLGSAGAETLREPFLKALATLFPDRPIFERSDTASRKREGLLPQVGFVKGTLSSPLITKFDGIPVKIDFEKGQKTGAFLDAREMRRHLRAHAKGKKILDCFSHIGLFSRYADAGGAATITVVETDKEATQIIREVLPSATIIEENAFEVLRQMVRDKVDKKRFDRVVLDPPAFTKDARSVGGALRGYNEINLRGMQLLNPGGLLYTSSCSYHLTRELFFEMLRNAAKDAGKKFRIVQTFSAASDHPVLLSVPETDYFKGAVLECLS